MNSPVFLDAQGNRMKVIETYIGQGDRAGVGSAAQGYGSGGAEPVLIVSTVEQAVEKIDADGCLVIDDTIKGTTLGDPDGPLRFIPEFDAKVPTYLDRRLDLVLDMAVEKRSQRLDYHVPYKLRGDFKYFDWPKRYRQELEELYPDDYGDGDGIDSLDGADRINDAGYVMCAGIVKNSKAKYGSVVGGKCRRKAVNRNRFCGAHGGALHLADKKISNRTLAPIDTKRVEKLDRVQKFMQGLLGVEELDDDEVQGNFVRNSKGVPILARHLHRKFEMEIAKELHVRLNRYLRTKTGGMLEVMVGIAENDLYEAADRIKAAQWVAERTMGKTPDVIIHGQTNTPYENILESMGSGSREDHRREISSVSSSRGTEIDGEIIWDGDDRNGEYYDGSDNERGWTPQGQKAWEARLAGGNSDEDTDEDKGWDKFDDYDSEELENVEWNDEGDDLENEGERNAFTEGESGENSSRKIEEGSSGAGTEGPFFGGSGFAAAQEIKDRKVAAKEHRDRIQKARKRRFGARAAGAKRLSDWGGEGAEAGWWLADFRLINQKAVYALWLLPPGRLSPAIIRRAVESHPGNEDMLVESRLGSSQGMTRRKTPEEAREKKAEDYDALVEKLEAELALLKSGFKV